MAGIAAVIQAIATALLPGILLVVSACPAQTDLVGTSWVVQNGVSTDKTNKTYAELSFKVIRAAGITQAMPA